MNKNINLKDIETKSERVLDLEFVEEIKSPELLFTRDSTTLYLYLKKKFSNSFDGFIGFNTDEETKKLNLKIRSEQQIQGWDDPRACKL